MEINYHLTEEDYLNFNMFHVKNSKTAMKSLRVQRIIGPIIFMIFSFIFSKIANIPFPGLLITFLVLSFLWFIFYPKYFFGFVMRHTKKMIQEGRNDGLLGKHHLQLTEECVIETTSSGKLTVNWSSMKECKEDTAYFYLYNSAVSAIILPKRSLTNVDDTGAYVRSKVERIKGND